MQSISVFLDIAKFVDFQWKNTDVSRTQGMWHVTHIIFWISFRLGITVPSFIIVGYVQQILAPPLHHPWVAPKMPILNRVKHLTAKWIEMANKLNQQAVLRLLNSGDVANNKLYYHNKCYDTVWYQYSPSPNPIKVRVCAIQNAKR